MVTRVVQVAAPLQVVILIVALVIAVQHIVGTRIVMNICAMVDVNLTTKHNASKSVSHLQRRGFGWKIKTYR